MHWLRAPLEPEGRQDELECEEKHRSCSAGWAAERMARVGCGVPSTQAPVAPVALVPHSLGLPGESLKTSNLEGSGIPVWKESKT